jgi:4-amino-4-deoxy-L-arabinose transferase-like glycosyltransferase
MRRTESRRLWLITALFAALLVWWATITPPTFGPDEYKHVDLVRGVATHWRYPAFDERRVSHQMLEALRTVPFDGHLTKAEAVPRGDRPSLRDFGNDAPTARRNHIAAHPPAFYFTLAAPYALLRPMLAGLSFDWTFLALRFLSLAILLPVPAMTFSIARRVGLGDALATTAALLPLAVPNFVFVSATVNNDALLVTLATAATLLLVRVATGDTTRRTAALLGVAIGLALLTKLFAWVLIPAALVAYAMGPDRHRRNRLATTGVLAFVAGGWWFVRNVVVYRHVQPTIGLHPDAPASFHPSIGEWAREFVPMFLTSFWARFGNAAGEARLVSIIGWVLLLGAVVAALVAARRALPRPRAGVVVVPFLALVGFIAVGSYASYARTDAFGAMKGRYLDAAIAPLMVLVAAGIGVVVRKRERLVPLGVLAAIVIVHAWSFVVVLSHYWGPQHASVATRVGAVMAWSPLPTDVLVAVWVAIAVVVVVSADSLRAVARR